MLLGAASVGNQGVRVLEAALLPRGDKHEQNQCPRQGSSPHDSRRGSSVPGALAALKVGAHAATSLGLTGPKPTSLLVFPHSMISCPWNFSHKQVTWGPGLSLAGVLES